jgi:hypothetical protein
MLGFIFSAGRTASVPRFLGYFISNSLRFTPLLWMLLTFIALKRNRHAKTAWMFHGASLVIGFAALLVTRMRFLLLEQVAALAVVFMTRPRFGATAVGRALACALFGVALVIVATDIKTTGDIRDESLQERSPTATLETFLYRSASFHADAITRESDYAQSLFFENRQNIILEMLSGIPFSGMASNYAMSDPTNTFDMRFLWLRSRQVVYSSFFVSGFTAVRQSMGMGIALMLAILAGLLQGQLAARARASGAESWWIIPQAAVLPVGLHGFRKADFARVAVNLLLFPMLGKVWTTTAVPRRSGPQAALRMSKIAGAFQGPLAPSSRTAVPAARKP